MGIKDNLRLFVDPGYSGFIGYPPDPASAALSWTSAIAPEIAMFLAPSAPSGLIAAAAPAAFIATLSPAFFKIIPDVNNFCLGFDLAMASAASAIQASSAPYFAVGPTSPFDSAKEIFDIEKQYTPLEICQRCEERIKSWLQTGTYTAFYIPAGAPPAGFPGFPGTNWGASPVLSAADLAEMDLDQDGVLIPDDAYPEDPDAQ